MADLPVLVVKDNRYSLGGVLLLGFFVVLCRRKSTL
jgi:hypothetical protein